MTDKPDLAATINRFAQSMMEQIRPDMLACLASSGATTPEAGAFCRVAMLDIGCLGVREAAVWLVVEMKLEPGSVRANEISRRFFVEACEKMKEAAPLYFPYTPDKKGAGS